MTDLQKRFADEYLIDSHIKNAAIRAGVKGINPKNTGWQMMRNPEVRAYVEKRQDEIAEKAEISAVWVINRFKEISDRCMTAEPVMIKVDGIWVESGEYQFDSTGANNATSNLGKIIGVFEKDNNQSNKIIINPTPIAFTKGAKGG